MTDRRDPLFASQSQDVAASWGRRLLVLSRHAVVMLVLCVPVDSPANSRALADDDDDTVPAVPAERQMILRGQQIILRGQQVALDRGQIQQIAIQQMEVGGGQIQVVMVIDGVEHFQNEDQSATSETATRKRFHLQLDSQVQAMNRLYSLSEAQKKKLQLAGKGDIHQYFSRLYEIRVKVAAQPPQGQPFNALVKEHHDVVRSGLFGDDSLFQKTLRTMLTEEQRTRFRSIERGQQQRILESVMEDWDRAADRFKLWGEPRKKFIELLVPHLQVPVSAGAYSHQIVFLEAWRLREQVRPLLTADEWKKFEWQVGRAQEMIPALEARGLWTARLSDDAGEASPDAAKE